MIALALIAVLTAAPPTDWASLREPVAVRCDFDRDGLEDAVELLSGPNQTRAVFVWRGAVGKPERVFDIPKQWASDISLTTGQSEQYMQLCDDAPCPGVAPVKTSMIIVVGTSRELEETALLWNGSKLVAHPIG